VPRALAVALALLPALLAAPGCGALLARDETERGRQAREPAFFARETEAILVEVDWRRGRAPSEAALEALEARLGERTGKPVVVSRDDEIAPGEDPDARADVRAIERAHPRIVGLRVLYEARSPDGLRGLCRGRDLFVYRDRIDDHAILWVRGTTLERTVLVHEAGHALGLDHCTRPDCVMYKPAGGEVWDWRMVLANLPAAFFLGRTPDDFCPLCRRDLDDPRSP